MHGGDVANAKPKYPPDASNNVILSLTEVKEQPNQAWGKPRALMDVSG